MLNRNMIAWMMVVPLAAPSLCRAGGPQGVAMPAPDASTPGAKAKPTTGETRIKTPMPRTGRIPTWTRDASWYEIVVSRFRNGDAANDPPECLPSSADPTSTGGTAGKSASDGESGRPDTRNCGGDLQGLQSKFLYLKKLGVNTLYLASIFQSAGGDMVDAVDMRHVDDALGVDKSFAALRGETGDPKTWKFSASDRVFLGFLTEAHKAGFRVVLEGRFGNLATPRGSSKNLESYVLAATARWMDPDGDGDPSDGIDGWVVSGGGGFWKRTGNIWRIHVKRTNPKAVVVGDLRESPLGHAASADFDLVIAYDMGEHVRRFFSAPARTYPLQKFVDELAGYRARYTGDRTDLPGRIILPLAGQRMGRLFPAIAARGLGQDEAVPARWRLAAVFQHFYAAAPMGYYGDEVGMRGTRGGGALSPMWWNDASDPETRSANYRGDFLALVRMLNALRHQFPSLRRGDFRPVMLDEGRRIFAFSRALPGEKAVVVMNYGEKNYRVSLPAGRPGRLVRVVDPQLAPVAARRRGRPPVADVDLTRTARLRVGGTRQFADQRGEMSLWVAPMSVRIALLSDDG